MNYKLSPREEIYNRKYNKNDKKESNLCILFITVYMSISNIVIIYFIYKFMNNIK